MVDDEYINQEIPQVINHNGKVFLFERVVTDNGINVAKIHAHYAEAGYEIYIQPTHKCKSGKPIVLIYRAEDCNPKLALQSRTMYNEIFPSRFH